MKKISLLLLTVLLAITSQSQNVTVSGALVGNGSYPDMGAAFTAVNGGAQTGANIIISVAGNTTETVSAILNAGAWVSVTIRPSGGAARTISGAITGVLIDLNGASNVTIDGLNTGGNSLTVSNTAIAASNTLRFINDASNNTIQNCTIQGSANVASNGVIFFSTGTTTGNDGNNINNCNITAAGASLPVNGVFSQGTSAAINNSGNTLNANNISDFFNADLLTSGINIGTGNSTWTITNNKLFQTATRTYTIANIHNGINVGSGDGNTITGNTIGYASSTGTGVYTMAGTIATRFIAINLAVGTATATSVQGNTITAISLATSSGAATTNGILCGINITAGNANVGNVTPNTIGASSGTGALTAIPTTTQGVIVGIHSSSTGTILIQNNIIGSFSSSGTTAAVAGGVFGITSSGVSASMTITGNTIGNGTAENMKAGTLGLTTGSSIASGINIVTTPVILSVTNNTVQNFASYGTGTGGYVRGINGSTAVNTTASYTISQNTINNLTTNSALTGYTSGNTSAYGIQFSGGANGTCSQNTISNISNINATATTNIVVSGINLASGANTSAFRNRIWGLSNASVGTTATTPPVVAGIIVRSGTTGVTVHNNMISIGDGQTTNTCFLGIMLNHGSTPDPLDNIYFNTVVISGTSAGGALISSCLNRGDLTATSRNQVVDIKNNIFINSRTGGTGNHYAISNNPNATSSATGWAANASNYNVLNAAASTIGYWTTAQTFAGWQTASASDANSISGPAVNLVNIPAGDLHIVFPPSSVIEAAGILIPAITDDFDGETRASFSPTDIGADAGNFVAAGLNMGAEALVTPAVAANGCYTSAETVTIKIRNSDINPINFVTNPVTVTTNVTGAVTQTLSAVVNTGSLGAGLSLDVPMTGTLNMGATGVYTFNAFTAVGGDTNPGNDAMPPVNLTKAVLAAGTASASPNQYCITGGTPTLSTAGATGYGGIQWQQSTTPATGFTDIPGATTNPFILGSPITQTMYYRLVASCNGNTVISNEVTVTLNNPQITGTTPGASCGPGPVTVTLAATGTGPVLNWYDVPTGGVPIGTGSPFTTPPISINTTYYVTSGSGGGVANVGLPAQLAGTSGAGTTNFGLVFDALAPFTLNTVKIYPIAAAAGTAGTVTIDIVDAANVVLNTATVAVVGNPVATATAQTVTLNFAVATGTNLKLRPGSRSAGITGLLFEPSATAPPGGNYGYPFVIPGVVSINHSTLTAPPANTARLDLYYYFYNWEVSTGCESARTPVLATVTTPPAATISYAGSPYCTSGGTATVTQTGTPGGTYSSTAGLTLNPATGDVTLGTSTPGTYTVTYTIPASGGCPLYTTTTNITVNTCGGNADLAITKTDGVTVYTPGGSTTYTIVASNAGPNPVTGATITDNFPAAITSVAWTAVYAGGATGPANGAGNINATVNIPVGGTATFTAVCNISGAASGNLVNTATVAVPVGDTDPNAGNNSATDTDTQAAGACSPITVNAPTITQPNCATATGTIVINASGSGTLEYSVDGVTYQASATFSGLVQGTYYISARYAATPACAMAYSGNPVVISSVSSRVQTVLAGASAFQDSLWTVRYPALSPVLTHVGPTLAGFTITGINGLATHPMTGEHYAILKVSGVSGRVLAKINMVTGVCTQVGNLGDNFSSITFRYDGQMFGVTGDGATVPETMYLIDHTNAAKTLARALGNGADGEVICYNPDDNFIYHWSGNGTVVYEKIQAISPYAITNIPIIGSTNGETFGAWYKGGGEFVTSNIGSSFNIFTTGGTVTGPFGSNPDDLRGLVSKTCVSYLTPACPNLCSGNVLLTANGGTGNYQWYLNGAVIGGANSSTYTATVAGLYNCIFTDACSVTDSVSVGIIVTSGAPPDAVATPASQTICSGSPITTIVLSGSVPSTTFNWTRDNTVTVTGIAASGAGNISGTLTNTTSSPVTVTFTITPTTGTCTGAPITATVIVNPIPTVNTVSNMEVCAGALATATFSGAVAGTVYNWTNSNPAIGLGASGTGNLSFTATNAGAAPIVGTITVTPTYTNGGTTCTGTPTSFTITVNPSPTVNTIPNQTLCQGQPTAPVNFTGTPAGVVYQWTNSNTQIGLAASGLGNIASFITTNPTTAPITGTITVTPVTGLSTPVATNFNYTGAVQTFTVPAGITSINIKAWGAQGNSNAGGIVGGLGGYAEGNLAVVPGQVLNVLVGGGATSSINGGFNGGGAAGVNGGCAAAQGGGGGGSSDIRITPYALANRVIVGAGGGGAGGNRTAGCGRGAGGGGGGGYYGGGGGAGWPGIPGSEGPVPTGGTQAAGGAGGITTFSPGPTNGFPGVLGVGGAGGTEVGSAQGTPTGPAERGGIGGGLIGGSGLYNNANNWNGQSGAGGSSYIGGVSAGLTTPGLRTGNGLVTITYTPPSATTCFGTPRTFTITVNPNPSLVIVADPGSTLCQGDPALLTVRVGTSSPVGTLYTQGVSPAANGSPSQVFEPANATFTSQSADDFTVPAGTSWTVTRVTADGIGAGIPTSVNVFFYNNSASNLPGTVVASYPNLTTYVQTGANYNVTLPAGLVLASGTYWVSVQVNMSFATGGQWFWGNFGATNIGNEYAWQNPGGGFATPCTNWGYGSSGCGVGGAVNRNNIFSIVGSSLADGGPLPGGYTFLWSPAAGLSSTTTNPVAASPATTTTYTVTVNTAQGCTNTASILMTVNLRPTVTSQPASRTNCVGSTATFTVAGTGTNLAYQWQVSTTGCAGPWTNLTNVAPYSGVNTATLTVNPVALAMNNNQYRCVLTGVCAPIGTANITNCAVLTVNPLPVVTVTPTTGCGGVAGSFGTLLTASGANSYTWAPLAGLYTDPACTIAYTGTNTATVYAAPTTFTAYTVTGTFTATGCSSTATALLQYTPPAPTVTPSAVTMCLGGPSVRLVSSSSSSTNVQFCSGPISVIVPDANLAGSSSNITVSGIPAACNVSAMSVTWNMPHTWDGDVAIVLKSPNGAVLNLDYFLSGTGAGPTTGFVNTTVSSTGTAALGSGTNPFTGTFKADAVIGTGALGPSGPTAFAPTVTTWAPLYTNPNGTWTLAMYDGFGGDQGTLTSWCLNFTYVCGVPSTPAVWTPIGGLWNDSLQTSPYVAGTPKDTVWTRPTPAGVYNYQATVQSLGGPASAITTTFANNNAFGLVIFNFKNNNTFPVNITGIESIASTSGASIATLYYKTTPIAGPPGAISAANGWLPAGTGNYTAIANTTTITPQPFLSGLSLTIPAGATYGIGVESKTAAGVGNLRYSTVAAGVYTISANGCDLITGTNIGYAGDIAPATLLNTPRGFIGIVRFGSNATVCTSPARTVVVTVNSPATITTQPVSQVICTDKVATFTVAAGGSGPFSYQWQVSTDNGNTWTNIANGGVYAGATTATLTITAPPVSMNNNFYRAVITGAAPCASANSFQAKLTVNPLPTVVITASPYTSLFPGLRTTLSSTVSPSAAQSYTWLRNGTPVSGANAATLAVTVDGLGAYTLRVTDVNGCTNTSNQITIKDSVTGKCFIYPNPSDGRFQVRYYSVANNAGVPRTLTVYDSKGTRVMTQYYTIGRPYDRMDVDLRTHGKGLYWVEVGDMNGNRLTMCRVVIE